VSCAMLVPRSGFAGPEDCEPFEHWDAQVAACMPAGIAHQTRCIPPYWPMENPNDGTMSCTYCPPGQHYDQGLVGRCITGPNRTPWQQIQATTNSPTTAYKRFMVDQVIAPILRSLGIKAELPWPQ
jgi:hypothetical protein